MHAEALSNESTRPLAGWRVLVPRAEDQAEETCAMLAALGAEPIRCPVITFAPPDDIAALDAALRRLAAGTYDWVVFTSVNGVRHVHTRLHTLALPVTTLAQARIAVIGPATAHALEELGLHPALVPSSYIAEAVADTLIAQGIRGQRVLILRAAEARPVLPERLRAAGAIVDVVAAYRTVPAPPPPHVLTLLRRGDINAVLFTSGSTVHNLIAGLGPDAPRLLQRVRLACIGPVTADVVRGYGLPVAVVAETHTVPGLLAALVAASVTERSQG